MNIHKPTMVVVMAVVIWGSTTHTLIMTVPV